MLTFWGILLVAVVVTSGVPLSERCRLLIQRGGISAKFNETIAHSIHSMTVRGLKMFNPRVTVDNNNVPTINRDLGNAIKVLPYSPDDSLGTDFATDTMNVIDAVFQHLGDSHGLQWSTIGRAIHEFHMWDIWVKIRESYRAEVVPSPPGDELCDCLTDTTNNGVHAALQEGADKLYEVDARRSTVLALDGKVLPELTSAETWRVWKKSLLRYYYKDGLYDVANYLYCATRNI